MAWPLDSSNTPRRRPPDAAETGTGAACTALLAETSTELGEPTARAAQDEDMLATASTVVARHAKSIRSFPVEQDGQSAPPA